MNLSKLAALLLAGGTLAFPAGAFAEGSSTVCSIRSFRSAPAAPTKSRRFSAGAVLELRPVVTLGPGGAQPGDTLEVRFFAPTGNLYEARPFAVPTEEEINERERRRQAQDGEDSEKGDNRSDEADREKGSGHLAPNEVETPPLLVGGTAISSSSIFGRWQAEIWSPGAKRRSCASTFEITR